MPVQVWAANVSGTELKLWLGSGEGSPEAAFCYITTDIGAWGVFLESNDPLPVGTAMLLELTLPGDPLPMRMAGSVIRVVTPAKKMGTVPGMGVAFDELSPEQRQRLERFLASVGGG